MKVTVDRQRLREVVQMGWGSGYDYYLDLQTGEVVSVPEGIFSALEEGDELRASWRECREVAEEIIKGTGRYLQVPTLGPDEIYAVLVDLLAKITDENERECLTEALAHDDYVERFEEMCAFDPDLYERFSELLDEFTDRFIDAWLRKNGVA